MRLPFPPSQNHAWRSVLVDGRVQVHLSERGRAYRAAVAMCPEVWAHPRADASWRLRLVITLCAPDRRKRDLDNHVKQVIDALMHAGLIPDDSQIDQLVVNRGPVSPRDGHARVGISPLLDGRPVPFPQRNPRMNTNRTNGLTLIEVLVAAVITGIFAAIVLPLAFGHRLPCWQISQPNGKYTDQWGSWARPEPRGSGVAFTDTRGVAHEVYGTFTIDRGRCLE